MSTDSSTQTYTVGRPIQDALAAFLCERDEYTKIQSSQLGRTAALRVIEIFCNDPDLDIRLFCGTCSKFREDCNCHTGSDGLTCVNQEVRRWCFLQEEYDTMKKLASNNRVTLPVLIDEYFLDWLEWLR